jgi:hypothetical protein
LEPIMSKLMKLSIAQRIAASIAQIKPSKLAA